MVAINAICKVCGRYKREFGKYPLKHKDKYSIEMATWKGVISHV